MALTISGRVVIKHVWLFKIPCTCEHSAFILSTAICHHKIDTSHHIVGCTLLSPAESGGLPESHCIPGKVCHSQCSSTGIW
jgi:hypothetical protein